MTREGIITTDMPTIIKVPMIMVITTNSQEGIADPDTKRR